jgi:dinuclear metal center YbgI/SA1388 family protein
VLTVGDVVRAVHARYPPSSAEPWDAVGLACGDPDAPVERVLLAVDPTTVVVDEAIAWGADLLLTHHPLLLRAVHSVAADTAKGRIVHRLVRHGVALLTAHTNADVARPGVSDALAQALGLVDLRPLEPRAEPLDKVVTFVPHPDASRVLDALAAAGAGRIGDYERCGYLLEGTGTFRPLPGASPAVGEVGRVETVPETRLEMVLPRRLRRQVVAALRASHPYEEPAFDVWELAGADARRGLGRVGVLPEPETLEDLVGRVAAALPATAAGVRAAGDPDRVVQAVAVCAGSGDSLLSAARAADVDAFVTADLRHHPASEAVEAGGPALVDVAHWASEWPWLPHVASLVRDDLGKRAPQMRVSVVCTDPWTMHGEPVLDVEASEHDGATGAAAGGEEDA